MLTIYGLMKFWAGLGGAAPVVESNVIKTIGLFKSSVSIGNLSTNSINGILKTSKTIGTLK